MEVLYNIPSYEPCTQKENGY